MESNVKQFSIGNTQSSVPSEDPNQTISDDEDENQISTRPHNDSKRVRQHGRWTKQEQILFLTHIVNSKGSIAVLSKYLPKRSPAQIQIHSHQFIQMCNNEFSVSKTKQQNKIILNRICQSYGFQPSDVYLSQLESFILEPSYELARTKSKKNRLSCKTITKKKKTKPTIFSIQKTQRKTKVINIVTINVLTNHHSVNEQFNTINHNININDKSRVPNPFNINFDNEILNTTNKNNTNIINNEIGINKDHHKGDIEDKMIESFNEGNDVNSSIIEFESFNY